MISTTVKLTIYGDSHAGLLDNADEAISRYINNWFEEVNESSPQISYELLVHTNDKEASGRPENYRAEVLARFKDEW
jgi:hypothetical protein